MSEKLQLSFTLRCFGRRIQHHFSLLTVRLSLYKDNVATISVHIPLSFANAVFEPAKPVPSAKNKPSSLAQKETQLLMVLLSPIIILCLGH